MVAACLPTAGWLAGWLAEYMLVHVLHSEGLLQLLQGQPTQVPALLACLCACVPVCLCACHPKGRPLRCAEVCCLTSSV